MAGHDRSYYTNTDFSLTVLLDDGDNLQPHEKRFKERISVYEDYLRKLDPETTWPIHDTHCTIPKIHKPTKQEFTQKCMKPGLLYYFNLLFWPNKLQINERKTQTLFRSFLVFKMATVEKSLWKRLGNIKHKPRE